VIALIGMVCYACQDVPEDDSELARKYVDVTLRLLKNPKEGIGTGKGGRAEEAYWDLGREMEARGDAVLPKLIEVFRELPPKDKALFLNETDPMFCNWPIFSPKAGAFLMEQSVEFEGETRINALFLAARCGEKKAMGPLRKALDDYKAVGNTELADRVGLGLLAVGNGARVPYWAGCVVNSVGAKGADGHRYSDTLPPEEVDSYRTLPQTALKNLMMGGGGLWVGPMALYLENRSDVWTVPRSHLFQQMLTYVGRADLATEPSKVEANWRKWSRSQEGLYARALSWAIIGKLAVAVDRKPLAVVCYREALRLAPKHQLAGEWSERLASLSDAI